jgi:hypothetical protein
MIDWHPVSEKAPEGCELLLFFEDAVQPVFGHAYSYSSGRQDFSSAMARGVVWTHWARINHPEKRDG